ncbi:MAG: hypothetical protein PHP59_08590 [Methanofollis sp.]|uniref:hypothetical protein n=1 Tax=Methanofollis sp. TaxID=2052835 RepID=UPI002623343A|nr:hypothetical protein [Methanofollis sp.]MDD4255417.1 hypothetical protein [Methanofollis sp.]
MKFLAHGLAMLLLLLLIVVPVAAADDSRYSYLTVQSVEIHLDNHDAKVNVTYTIDDGVQILVHLLGMSDLREKVLEVVNFKGATIEEITMDHAVLTIPGVGLDYGRGTFWFPEHEFPVKIPSLVVASPQDRRAFQNTAVFPEGMGYFKA